MPLKISKIVQLCIFTIFLRVSSKIMAHLDIFFASNMISSFNLSSWRHIFLNVSARYIGTKFTVTINSVMIRPLNLIVIFKKCLSIKLWSLISLRENLIFLFYRIYFSLKFAFQGKERIFNLNKLFLYQFSCLIYWSPSILIHD
jgi:hypothetical protein